MKKFKIEVKYLDEGASKGEIIMSIIKEFAQYEDAEKYYEDNRATFLEGKYAILQKPYQRIISEVE